MLTLIVARAHHGAIGRDGDIPWQLPADLRMFQRETLGGARGMGRGTWDSLPVKPLGRRLNIVVSRDSTLTDHVVPDVEAALALARAEGYHRVYGIGGAGIYREMLAYADRLLITEVDTEVTAPDTHFPEVLDADWRLIGTTLLRTEAPRCAVRELLRRG